MLERTSFDNRKQKKLSDTGNRTPSCRVRGGNVNRYTISDGKDERREQIYTSDLPRNSFRQYERWRNPETGPRRGTIGRRYSLYRRNLKGMEGEGKGNMI